MELPQSWFHRRTRAASTPPVLPSLTIPERTHSRGLLLKVFRTGRKREVDIQIMQSLLGAGAVGCIIHNVRVGCAGDTISRAQGQGWWECHTNNVMRALISEILAVPAGRDPEGWPGVGQLRLASRELLFFCAATTRFVIVASLSPPLPSLARAMCGPRSGRTFRA